MSTRGTIEMLEFQLENAKREYLLRYGWKNTSSTPGSYWLWRRDFADQDAKMVALIEKRRLPSPHVPWGVVTVTEDLAVQMTMKTLDVEYEGGEDE